MSNIPRRNVTYQKPSEPSFLKDFKAKVGYKAPPGIEAKRPVLKPANDEEEEVERDDELPTVVVLRKGDVGEEEYMEMRRRLKGEGSSQEDAEPTVAPRPSQKEPVAAENSKEEEEDNGKIKFRKPRKRKSSDGGGVLDASTSSSSSKRSKQEKKVDSMMGGASRRRRQSSEGESNSRQIKNKSLLSFGEDEDDD